MCGRVPRAFVLVPSFVAALAVCPAAGPVAQGPAVARPAGLRMLTRAYDRDFLLKNMQATSAWRPFPSAADRASWERLLAQPLNESRRAWIVKGAEALIGKPWPALPATLYMEFARDGNRSRFESQYFARRKNLATLVLAECFEHKGRFLDEIANGLWAITEEATWCVPAHAARGPKDVLQLQDLESVDLFAAETAMTLATARYLLRAELEQLSFALSDRVSREVLRRIIDPVAASDSFGSAWWLDGRNNWSPWCASNVLGAAMFLVDDPAKLAALASRMMAVLDRFIDRYGDDGGCDEGPGYWNEAAGAMLVFLELLHSRTGGAVDIYHQPKIAAMGRFIVNAHIAGPWFINFADADAKTTPHPGKVYRFGERVKEPAMENLALLAMRDWQPDGAVKPPLDISGVSRAMLGPLMEIFWIPPDAKPGPASLPTSVWMPDIQLLVARESGASPYAGLFLAARGGHNAESHNHNDVGNVVIYLDGQPGIIDIGRETYTAQTFGANRYDLWFTRGSAHNAPIVNGTEQKEGRAFEATGVEYRDDRRSQRLGMNLEKAYPAGAGLRSLRREIEYLRNPPAAISVRDAWTLVKGSGRLEYAFYALSRVEEVRPGRLAIRCSSRSLLVDYNPETLKVRVETVPIEDMTLNHNWGARVYRIVFEVASPSAAGRCEFRFRAAE
jgi:hypothetical protein